MPPLNTLAGSDINLPQISIQFGADGPAQDYLTISTLVAGQIVTHQPVINGTVFQYQLNYGTLTLDTATGAWAYRANGLGASSAQVTEDIFLTVKDSDGDVAQTNIPVNISKPPFPLPISLGMDEAFLPDGTMPNANATSIALPTLPADYNIVAGGSSVYGKIIQAGGIWQYEFTGNVDHGGGNPNYYADNITITIADNKGNVWNVPVTVTITDDAPRLSATIDSEMAGHVTVLHGADGRAATDWLTVKGGTLLPGSPDDTPVYELPSGGTVTLDLSATPPTWLYTPPASPSYFDTVIFVATDGDGDRVESLPVEIHSPTSAPSPAPATGQSFSLHETFDLYGDAQINAQLNSPADAKDTSILYADTQNLVADMNDSALYTIDYSALYRDDSDDSLNSIFRNAEPTGGIDFLVGLQGDMDSAALGGRINGEGVIVMGEGSEELTSLAAMQDAGVLVENDHVLLDSGWSKAMNDPIVEINGQTYEHYQQGDLDILIAAEHIRSASGAG